ncbi:MAG TPA: sulfotransferase [Trueperaceae bacterium]
MTSAAATISTRAFLVGCPRSGTTLLQSLLAAHPQVASFPETHFFSQVVSDHRWLRALGLASPDAAGRFADIVKELGCAGARSGPARALFVRQYTRMFTEVLDGATVAQGKSVWLEKTPSHLHYVARIERLVPEARFIHLIRNGSDVVASLYEVTHQHPEVWGGPRSIDACLTRWIRDRRRSEACQGKPNHLLVHFEQLVQQPGPLLQELCRFLHVAYNPDMLRYYPRASEQLVRPGEEWKAAVRGSIRNPNAEKFRSVFDRAQQAYILDRLAQAGYAEDRG